MLPSVKNALEKAKIISDDREYSIIQLPAKAITPAAGILAEIGEPFTALLVDRDEVTLIMPSDLVEEYAARLHNHTTNEIQYRLITFDVELEPTLVGFMATVSNALANAQIPIFPFAAFTRDHLLVPAADFDKAINTLEQLRTT